MSYNCQQCGHPVDGDVRRPLNIVSAIICIDCGEERTFDGVPLKDLYYTIVVPRV